MQNGKCEMLSGIAHIKVNSGDPIEVFREWYQEVKSSEHVKPEALIFATTSREGKVTARTVILRRLESDGLVIMTDRRSRKAKDLAENPQAAVVFLWNYYDKNNGEKTDRQVRMEGIVHELQADQYQDLYDNEPLFCKIRSHLCNQGCAVDDWEQYKAKHDELLDGWNKGENSLPMPEHFVAYKFIPTAVDFYYAWGNMIGDRMFFLKDKDSQKWSYNRVQA